MLRVKGDSMVDAGIFDGDLVAVRQQQTARNGEIVAAMIEDEATVKRFYKEGRRVRLQAENTAYPPIYSDSVRILGKVILSVRTYKPGPRCPRSRVLPPGPPPHGPDCLSVPDPRERRRLLLRPPPGRGVPAPDA